MARARHSGRRPGNCPPVRHRPHGGDTVRGGRPAAAAEPSAAAAGAARRGQRPRTRARAKAPPPNRHVKVSVEWLKYPPARLSELRRLARRLVEGRTVPGHGTRTRLNVVERVMPRASGSGNSRFARNQRNPHRTPHGSGSLSDACSRDSASVPHSSGTATDGQETYHARAPTGAPLRHRAATHGIRSPRNSGHFSPFHQVAWTARTADGRYDPWASARPAHPTPINPPTPLQPTRSTALRDP